MTYFLLSNQVGVQQSNFYGKTLYLEGFGDFETLNNSPTCQHVDDGLFVGPEALHGLFKGGGIGHRVERVRGINGGSALQKNPFYITKFNAKFPVVVKRGIFLDCLLKDFAGFTYHNCHKIWSIFALKVLVHIWLLIIPDYGCLYASRMVNQSMTNTGEG